MNAGGAVGGGVRAAGGVVVHPDGERVAVIHRPRYDDWSLPKGKLDPGEDDRTAALREIAEEIGVRGEITADLGTVEYVVDKPGKPIADKTVRYFTVTAVELDAREADDEVDELRWLPVDQARDLVSYDRDRDVLDRHAAR